jgi:hypothetical protein
MRLKIMGLCLVAMFALTAAVTASASAAEPAFYECKKVVGGKFLAKCKTEGGKGGFAIVEGVGKGKAFKGTGGEATLHTPAVGGVVSCKTFKDEGKVETPTKTGKVFSTFTSCVSLGKKCTTPGQKAGTIKTKELEGGLGYISKSPVKVGTNLKAKGGGELAEFNCEGLQINVTGAVIGEQTGDINTFNKTSSDIFKVNGEGFQEVKNFEGGPTEVLESLINGSGPFESGQQATAVNKGEELQIKA